MTAETEVIVILDSSSDDENEDPPFPQCTTGATPARALAAAAIAPAIGADADAETGLPPRFLPLLKGYTTPEQRQSLLQALRFSAASKRPDSTTETESSRDRVKLMLEQLSKKCRESRSLQKRNQALEVFCAAWKDLEIDGGAGSPLQHQQRQHPRTPPSSMQQEPSTVAKEQSSEGQQSPTQIQPLEVESYLEVHAKGVEEGKRNADERIDLREEAVGETARGEGNPEIEGSASKRNTPSKMECSRGTTTMQDEVGAVQSHEPPPATQHCVMNKGDGGEPTAKDGGNEDGPTRGDQTHTKPTAQILHQRQQQKAKHGDVAMKIGAPNEQQQEQHAPKHSPSDPLPAAKPLATHSPAPMQRPSSAANGISLHRASPSTQIPVPSGKAPGPSHPPAGVVAPPQSSPSPPSTAARPVNDDDSRPPPLQTAHTQPLSLVALPPHGFIPAMPNEDEAMWQRAALLGAPLPSLIHLQRQGMDRSRLALAAAKQHALAVCGGNIPQETQQLQQKERLPVAHGVARLSTQPNRIGVVKQQEEVRMQQQQAQQQQQQVSTTRAGNPTPYTDSVAQQQQQNHQTQSPYGADMPPQQQQHHDQKQEHCPATSTGGQKPVSPVPLLKMPIIITVKGPHTVPQPSSAHQTESGGSPFFTHHEVVESGEGNAVDALQRSAVPTNARARESSLPAADRNLKKNDANVRDKSKTTPMPRQLPARGQENAGELEQHTKRLLNDDWLLNDGEAGQGPTALTAPRVADTRENVETMQSIAIESNLRQELLRRGQDAERLLKDALSLEEEMEQLRKQKSDADTMIVSLTKAKTKAQTESKTHKRSLKLANAESEKQRVQIRKLEQSRDEAVQRETASVAREAELKRQLEAAQGEKDRLKRESEALQQQVRKLQAERDALASNMSSKERPKRPVETNEEASEKARTNDNYRDEEQENQPARKKQRRAVLDGTSLGSPHLQSPTFAASLPSDWTYSQVASSFETFLLQDERVPGDVRALARFHYTVRKEQETPDLDAGERAQSEIPGVFYGHVARKLRVPMEQWDNVLVVSKAIHESTSMMKFPRDAAHCDDCGDKCLHAEARKCNGKLYVNGMMYQRGFQCQQGAWNTLFASRKSQPK